MNLIQRAKNIIVTPKTEWNVVAGETATLGSLLGSYVLPLSLIPAICTFLGMLLFGGMLMGTMFGVVTAVISVVSTIIAYVVCTFIVDALAPSFKSEKNLGKSAQLVAYSATPAWIGGILGLIPFIGWLGALAGGIYAIYLMYLGMSPIKKTPEDQRVLYVIVAIIIYFVVLVVISMIFTAIIMATMFAGIGGMMMNGLGN